MGVGCIRYAAVTCVQQVVVRVALKDLPTRVPRERGNWSDHIGETMG